MLYDECKEQVQILFSYVRTHLGDEFDYKSDIEDMIEKSEKVKYLLDDAFIIICYIINNSDYKNISSSFSIRDFDFGGLNRKLLEMLYDCYLADYVDDEPPENIFPDQCQTFTECNTTFLQPTGVCELPKNGKVVEFAIKNCRNMIFDSRSVTDDEYIKSQFTGLTSNTGVNDKIIQRFDFLKDYGKLKSKDYIVDSIENIYQDLGGGKYRKLTNSKVQEADYDLINYNLAVTNWENKRMLALRQTIPKPIRAINFEVIKGSIKTNIFEKNMKVADAIFESYNNPNMSDNDILQIMIGAHMYQDKIRYVKRADFDKLFSIRDLEANII